MIQRIAWGAVELHKYVVEFHEEYGASYYGHRYPGRRGALQEKTSPGQPRKVTLSLNFESAARKAEIMNEVQQKTQDILVHPDVGRMKAILQYPIRTSYNFVNEGELSKVELRFEEDTLDQNLTNQKGVAARAQSTRERAAATGTSATALKDRVFGLYTIGATAARYRQLITSTELAFQSFASEATSYADAAEAQFSTGEWDPSLEQRLLKLLPGYEGAAKTMRLAARAGLPVPRGAAEAAALALALDSARAQAAFVGAHDLIQNAERTLAEARALHEALRARFPAPIEVSIESKVMLAVFVAQQYPGASFERRWALVEQIRRVNRLGRADILRTGMRITIPGLGYGRAA